MEERSAVTSEMKTQVAATVRDIQRAALRDLAALAAESAATEAQVEQAHQAAVQAAAKELDRHQWGLEERAKKAREEVEQEYKTRLSQVENQYQADYKALKNNERTARQRIDHDHAQVEAQIKQQYEQSMWLAESVFDGTQAQVHEELKKVKELFGRQGAVLDGIQQKGFELLRVYGVQPPSVPDPQAIDPPPEQGDTAYEVHRGSAERQLKAIDELQLPKLFVGARPVLFCILVLVLAAAGGQASTGSMELNLVRVLVATGAAAVLLTAGGIALRMMANSQVRQAFVPFGQALLAARLSAKGQVEITNREQSARHEEAVIKRQAEEQAARDKLEPILAQAREKRDASLLNVREQALLKVPQLQAARDQAKADIEQWHDRATADLKQRYDREAAGIGQRHAQHLAEAKAKYEAGRAGLEHRLNEGLSRLTALQAADASNDCILDWNDSRWQQWTPPKTFASTIRFGQLEIDLRKIASSVPKGGQVQLALPAPFNIPAEMAFPRQASLLLQADRTTRDVALRTIQMAMSRLLTCLPPGRVRFTIVDPVGLGQNFAGFMHLADHDEALVGGRIWTEAEHINQRLADLTEHMETVIQKYLRNEFETIDDYNAQAGELAEPYRFLVIADFPVSFEADAFRRLASIASSGARCGVYTLVLRDLREQLPSGTHIDELETHSANLIAQDGQFVWKDDVFGRFPLMLDEPPAEEALTRILDQVGRGAKIAKRVEVPFETIAPAQDQVWSASAAADLAVPIGRMGATRLQMLRLGRGVAQHTLIAGKTGSGKSTLLHVLVTNLALWYHPHEVEFYLVDFKKGVEFKTYATHILPHARAVAVESDREFGLSVLQRLDAELSRRGEMFRRAGVQDLPAYRNATSQSLPRSLLIIDEFQEFFSEDDKLAQDAALLLDRLVRQGRAFGIHVLLGSQTIGGTSGLSRSTIGQMAVRIALQTSEADSQIILGDGNSAARLLSRPGEAIYNDAGGLVEANSPFQISWLADELRERYLKDVLRRSREQNLKAEPPIVFEGNVPADIARNLKLETLLAGDQWPDKAPAPMAWLGDPVAIKEPTAVTFRRQSGSNALIVGQHEESAMAMMFATMLSLAAQQPPAGARFYVLDGTPADSSLAGVLAKVTRVVPHDVRLVEYRGVPEALAEVADEMKRRHETDAGEWPSVYVLVYGLQRYRALRHQEESFSFAADDEEKKPQADKLFADILREGPPVGVHVVAWCDTAAAIERTLDRSSMREFDHRILFQMSASDSSTLIDSPAANKLGFYRALAFSEEQGTLEKFRPYALPVGQWLEHARQRFAGRI